MLVWNICFEANGDLHLPEVAGETLALGWYKGRRTDLDPT